jgi:hypothetical protein
MHSMLCAHSLHNPQVCGSHVTAVDKREGRQLDLTMKYTVREQRALCVRLYVSCCCLGLQDEQIHGQHTAHLFRS